jgi:hypothetical protein
MEARSTLVVRVSARAREVLGETPVASEPGEGALDHPATRQYRRSLSCRLRLPISMRGGGTFPTQHQPATHCSHHNYLILFEYLKHIKYFLYNIGG